MDFITVISNCRWVGWLEELTFCQDSFCWAQFSLTSGLPPLEGYVSVCIDRTIDTRSPWGHIYPLCSAITLVCRYCIADVCLLQYPLHCCWHFYWCCVLLWVRRLASQQWLCVWSMSFLYTERWRDCSNRCLYSLIITVFSFLVRWVLELHWICWEWVEREPCLSHIG